MSRDSGNGPSRRTLLGALGLSALVAPSLLTACAPQRDSSDDSPSPAAGGSDAEIASLNIALPSSISSLDVGREAGILNYMVAVLAQESLLSVSPSGELKPGLAASWHQSDARTYVYRLRQGVTFTDGTPLTPADVVASIEWIMDASHGSQLAYAYAGVESVKATGEAEVTVRLKTADAAFAWTPTPGTLLISSQAFLAKHSKKGDLGTAQTLLMGTGPYKITEFAADDHVTLERNDAWWGGKARVKRLKLSFVPDSGTRLVAMKSGDIDGALNLASDEARSWESTANVTYTSDRSVVSLAFDTSRAPWSDPHVRKAVAHAADRAGMVSGILRGKGEAATALPSPDMWANLLTDHQVSAGYKAIPGYDYDLDAAAAELAKSSTPKGFTAELHYPSSGPQLGKAALALAASLKKIGITLNVKEVTLEAWISELGSGKHPLQFLWYYPTTGDPSELTGPYLDGASIKSGTNVAHYDNDAVNRKLAAAKSSTEAATRGRDLMSALQTSGADLPYLPLWWAQTASAFSRKLVLTETGPYAFIGPWATRIRSAA
ncbi:ABC transporter substrate-binding protein [Streptomyces sp. NPDC002088]|uniref:ABC transporter substrate-binding protein n=1 Tax=Streptomyces sp. NPDC002088 TaxID=3154665 RepID=UPI00331CD8AC